MDSDSKLIFESYKNSKIVNESVRGLWDLLFSAGRRPAVTFSRATIREVETSLKFLENNLLNISNSSLSDPKVFSDVSFQLGDQIVSLIRHMSQTVGANQPALLGQLRTITVNYNQTLQEFLELSKSGLTKDVIRQKVKEIDAGYDEVINMVRSTRGTSITRGFTDQIASILEQLKGGLREAEKFASEGVVKERGKVLLACDWMKAQKLTTIFIGLIVSLLFFGAHGTGYGITAILIAIGRLLKSIFTGGIFGAWDKVKEEYPEAGEAADAAKKALTGEEETTGTGGGLGIAPALPPIVVGQDQSPASGGESTPNIQAARDLFK